jgi:transposase-like protein
MHGNLLDAMSNAIENSSIFLMCITEKYKDSPSCRLGITSKNNFHFTNRFLCLECEYAYQRKKTIIPLLLQANYKAE